MSNAHVQITTQVRSGDVPKDFVVNNLYFQVNTTAAQGDFQNLADHVKGVLFSTTGFGGAQPWVYYAGRAGTIKVYDLADPKPRPEKGVATYTPTSWDTTALGPRLLASCLSYYAARNLPHTRGRIYLGPFNAGDVQEGVYANLMAKIMDLAKGINSIAQMGPLSWAHATYSHTLNQVNTVTNYWTNDVWDVQHSRAHSELSRLRYP